MVRKQIEIVIILVEAEMWRILNEQVGKKIYWTFIEAREIGEG